MSDQSDERRRGLRLAINTTVRVEHEGGVLEAKGADISDRGMLLITDQLLPVGTEVRISCVDETGKPVDVTAKISRHHTPGGDRPSGFVVTEVDG